MSDALRAPFPYFGGKSRVASDVWRRFGSPENYVEPFFGSGAVLLARPHKANERGAETVNDADALLANFWRAVQADPEAVAFYADWPVNEADLHARHLWLIGEGRQRASRLMADPDAYDVQAAGWWVWGISQWIGSGWCTGEGPWTSEKFLEEAGVETTGGASVGEPRQMPHLSSGGTGVHRKLPHVSDPGTGVHRKLPHVSDDGRGVHRPVRRQGGGVDRKRPELGISGKGVFRQLPSVNGIRESLMDTPDAIDGGRRDYLIGLMCALAERLREVRVCCGDWSRVVGPSVTTHVGLTAVFLDPPYSLQERDTRLYAVDAEISNQVRDWAIANGENPLLRIALCGYEGEHEMPERWAVLPWKAQGGYGSQGDGRGRENAAREVVWFSPHCLRPDRASQLDLFSYATDAPLPLEVAS